jgi:iron complex outermembrane receptor protein
MTPSLFFSWIFRVSLTLILGTGPRSSSSVAAESSSVAAESSSVAAKSSSVAAKSSSVAAESSSVAAKSSSVAAESSKAERTASPKHDERTAKGPPPLLGETVVTSARRNPVRKTTKKTISRRTLQATGRRNVARALEWSLGIQGETNSRGERMLMVRGFEQRQVPVYLDGVPLQIPYDGVLDLGKIPVGLLGEVAVIRGPASLALGPTGMGGAIHLRTRNPEKAPLLELDGRIAPGAAGLQTAAALATETFAMVAAADLFHRAYFVLPRDFARGRNEDGGRRENSDRNGMSAGVAARYRPHRNHRLSVIAVGALGNYGVPPSVKSFNPRYWRFSDYDVGAVTATHSGRWTSWLRTGGAFYFGYFRNVLDAFDDETYVLRETERAFHSIYRDWTFGGRLKGRVRLPRPGWMRRFRLYAWLDVRHDRHTHSWRDSDDPPTAATTMFDAAVEVASLFRGGHHLRLQLQTIAEFPGRTGNQRPQNTVFCGPLLTYGWANKRWDLHVTTARRSRFPTLKERYSLGFGLREPNPDLRPESAWQLHTGAEVTLWRRLTISLAAHAAWVTNAIDDRAIGDGLLQMQNVGRAVLAGAELEMRWRPPTVPALNARLGYAYLYARRLETASAEEEILSGRSPHQFFGVIGYRFWRYVQMSTGLRLLGPTPVWDPDTGARKTLDLRVDLRARLSLGPVYGTSVYFEGTNLLDRVIESRPGYPDPGRILWVGLRTAHR